MVNRVFPKYFIVDQDLDYVRDERFLGPENQRAGPDRHSRYPMLLQYPKNQEINIHLLADQLKLAAPEVDPRDLFVEKVVGLLKIGNHPLRLIILNFSYQSHAELSPVLVVHSSTGLLVLLERPVETSISSIVRRCEFNQI